tara:strand:- start:1391 stop:1720 length:330 start_codon:yes stop_codon:yes gene_type:complete
MKITTTNLHQYVREFRKAEKIAVDKVKAEYTALDGTPEERIMSGLNWRIEDAEYKTYEKYIYKFFELIESKNPLCTRSDAQRIASILLDDLSFSKWNFLLDCISGEIDR